MSFSQIVSESHYPLSLKYVPVGNDINLTCLTQNSEKTTATKCFVFPGPGGMSTLLIANHRYTVPVETHILLHLWRSRSHFQARAGRFGVEANMTTLFLRKSAYSKR